MFIASIVEESKEAKIITKLGNNIKWHPRGVNISKSVIRTGL
jgi:hypothetical protein